MANLQKHRAHESLNTDTAATWELITASTDAPASTDVDLKVSRDKVWQVVQKADTFAQ